LLNNHIQLLQCRRIGIFTTGFSGLSIFKLVLVEFIINAWSLLIRNNKSCILINIALDNSVATSIVTEYGFQFLGLYTFSRVLIYEGLKEVL